MEFTRNIEEKIIKSLNKNYNPVLLLGARQVGKTTVAKKIARNYSNYFYTNLESDIDIANIFNGNINIESIIQVLNISYNANITKDTLIIIDEIQNNPRAITALKYFSEQAKYKVLATGSNLGVTIFGKNNSFPVGKVSTINMYPMSFDEFLVNSNNINISKYLKSIDINSQVDNLIHNKCLDLFDIYMNIGGMPEVVKIYLEGDNFKEKQKELLSNYKNDFVKYADNKLSSRITAIYENIDIMLNNDNQKFRITKIDNKTYRELENPLTWLYNASVVIPCYKISSINLPLRSNIKENNFKLFFHDIGFLLAQSEFDYNNILLHNSKIYNGFILENYIAIVTNKYQSHLFYFEKNQSEIDFIVQINNQIVPIEVKSGTNTKAKALNAYINRYSPNLSIKVTRNNLNSSNGILNIPVYLFEYYLENNIV